MMWDVCLLSFEPTELSDKISMDTHQNVHDVFGLIGICCMLSLCTGLLGLPLIFLNVYFVVNL